MYQSLQRTPDMLDVLKEANVVDSGAYGYIVIIEGMRRYLLGDPVEYKETSSSGPVLSEPLFFNEDSEFKDGYCMEFLLQLLNCKADVKEFNINNFIAHLKELGSSLAVLKEGTIVKVHVHTLNPSPIIDIAKQYGEFINFKLENMQIQHNEFSIIKHKDEKAPKELGIIAVVNGKEIEEDYRELGCDYVISASGNMNASSDEFLGAIESINAKRIVIFPNNVNAFGAANQAIDLAKAKERAFIIPSKTMIEGNVALQMDMPDEKVESRINEFGKNIKLATTVGVTTASKDYKKDGFCCKINDKIALIDDKLVSVSDNVIDCLDKAIKSIENLTDKTGMMVYLSKSVTEDLEEKIFDYLSSLDGIEFQVKKGGQDIYDVLIGLF